MNKGEKSDKRKKTCTVRWKNLPGRFRVDTCTVHEMKKIVMVILDMSFSFVWHPLSQKDYNDSHKKQL